jgi:PAS domain S-box-containing protein
MHSLLKRQLRRAGFDYNTLPTDPVLWQEFLSHIERFYTNVDRERQLLQKHLTLTPVALLPENAPQAKIINALSDGLCVFDSHGQLVFANPAAERHLGATVEQLKLNGVLERFELHDQVNPNAPLSHLQLFQRVIEGYSFQDRKAYLKRPEQPPLPVSCLFNPLIDNQQVIGFTLLFSDISDLKTMEAELITAKESAEKASQAKSQFLSSMSHELRTPMNAILGYSELLKEDLNVSLEEMESEDIESMLQYVGNILHAGWHLLELINKVLDLTRIEAGKLEVTIEKVDLVDLIKECVSFVKPQAEKSHITLENETAALTPRYALVDRGRLKQVIINLLSNAVKYNNENGKVQIRIVQPHTETIRLEVQDTGVGLTEEQKSRVFDPFTRLSGLNLIEGTGIGLTITKRLLEIMDGKIGVESEINQGSTFWVELPTGEIVNNNLNQPDDLHLRRYILLYIEDSRTNVSLVAQILKARPDIALMSAHTGEMGLELAKMHHPDVILLDINLPGMDGFEVLAQLRKDEQTQNIPVIALSANDTAHQLERGHDAGFLSYMVKPLDIKKFLQSIDFALKPQEKP